MNILLDGLGGVRVAGGDVGDTGVGGIVDDLGEGHVDDGDVDGGNAHHHDRHQDPQLSPSPKNPQHNLSRSPRSSATS